MSGYIGSQPADSFLSISSQQITGNGGATYTLNSNVTSPEDIAIFVNNVRQNVNTYSVSNNQVTLGGTIASSDSCYVIFLGKTLATVNPPSGSVGNNQVSASLINSQTAESSANDSDEILIYDNSATALKKQTRANFLTGVGGTTSPYISVYRNGDQTLSDNTLTLIQFNVENVDSASAFDLSSYRFTPQVSGYYYVSLNVGIGNTADNSIDRVRTKIFKNGSAILGAVTTRDWDANAEGLNYNDQINTSVIVQMNGSSDYIDGRVLVDVTSGTPRVESQQASMHIFKMTE